MTNYNDRITADYSPLLVHFTKKRKMMMPVDIAHPLSAHQQSSAKEKLISILQSRTIHASPMPHLSSTREAVCFTECIWGGLVDLADVAYSPYGVVFQKKVVYDRGGGPALYVRGDSLKGMHGTVPEEIEAMIAPFDPDGRLTPNVTLDWLHEREWRLPRSLEFALSDVRYVIVDSVEDAMNISTLIDFPLRMFIAMEVYRAIKSAWPGGAG